jgi:hypothetical protein
MNCGDQDNKALILEIINDAIGHEYIGREHIDKVKQLYKCIQDGKVHIGGCIPINERVNETLEKILRNEISHEINHATARKTFEKMEFAIKAGRKASRRYTICSQEFNAELHMALTDMHYTAKNMGPDLVELAEMKVKQAEQRLEWAVNDLERKRSRR